MRPLLLLLFLASAAALGLADDHVTVNGKWELYSNIAGYENRQNCTFTQKESALTGTCNSERGDVEISGKVAGKEVSFSYKTEYQGSPITVSFKGNIESATKIAGTVTVPEYSVDGEFTATAAN